VAKAVEEEERSQSHEIWFVVDAKVWGAFDSLHVLASFPRMAIGNWARVPQGYEVKEEVDVLCPILNV